MMEALLKSDFIAHYALGICTVRSVSTNNKNFDLIDDTMMVHPSGTGIAKYNNINQKEVKVINYELFINSLSGAFQRGREKCDLIAYTLDHSHFILNELTDTDPKYVPDFTLTDGTPRIGKRNKAIAQLRKTLIDISKVPSILYFLNSHRSKKCCFFNKQINSPLGIRATAAFNRLSILSTDGFKVSDPVIESFGFELWEFSGNQTCKLSSIKKTIKIKQVKSRIGMPIAQKKTLDALGLRKLNRIVEHDATPSILGMINKVKHLVTII